MTVEEFREWDTYAALFMLPQRRMEYYMAQLTLQVAAGNGGKYTLSDFLFDNLLDRARSRNQDNAEDGAQIIGAMTGSRKVIKIGQRRKNG